MKIIRFIIKLINSFYCFYNYKQKKINKLFLNKKNFFNLENK
jgi:hypothetical protein